MSSKEPENAPQGVAVLGSTGSVGRNTLDVLRGLRETHQVLALAAGRNLPLLVEQMREFRPALVSVLRAEDAREIRETAGALGTEVVHGEPGAEAVARHPGADIVMSAIVGAAGVRPTHAAAVAGRRIALANKEAMVVAGGAVREAAARSGAELLPVDSEHCALHQCLRAGRATEVRRIVLTASGGPFWERPAETFAGVTVKEALAHPVWDMGAKISIDSATMMNKGLEVIEAHWLFDLPAERIDILVHPGSVVHSLVEFVDGSVIAQMGSADMRHPIQYALTWPARLAGPAERLDLSALPPLRFHPPDAQRFPCTRLAYRALDIGATAPAALNGGNEALVAEFLAGEIPFPAIAEGLARVLDAAERGEAPGAGISRPDVDDCLAADRWARDFARSHLTSRVTPPVGESAP